MATSNGLRVLCRGRHSIYTGPYGGDIKRNASYMQRAPLYLYRTVRWRHQTDCEFYAEGATLSIQDRTVATSNGLRVICRGRHSIYTGPYGGDIKRTASSMQRAPLYLYRTVQWRHQTDCEFYAEGATLSIQDRTVETSNGLRVLYRGHQSIYTGPYGGDIERTASSMQILDRTAATSNGLRDTGPYDLRLTDASLNIFRRINEPFIYDYDGTVHLRLQGEGLTTRAILFSFLLCCNHTYIHTIRLT